MYYLTVFKHFVSIISLIFDWPPFWLILDLFDPLFLQNVISDWVLFLLCAEPGYRKVGDVPPSRGQNIPFLKLTHTQIGCHWSSQCPSCSIFPVSIQYSSDFLTNNIFLYTYIIIWLHLTVTFEWNASQNKFKSSTIQNWWKWPHFVIWIMLMPLLHVTIIKQ